MKTLRFKCTLLSDVILNVKSASQGNNNTLDFIPGNCFLGIVAKRYKELNDKAMTLFHSGRVRFGDAHLGANGSRALKIPAAMFYPKLSSPQLKCYIHHKIDAKSVTEQLKQCRQGFYLFGETEAIAVQAAKRFAIKSAYDRHQRRSADQMMYGYESLVDGAELYFSVETDDDSLAQIITESLCGVKHIGRSRTAQYGLVKIEPFEFAEVNSRCGHGLTTVYADGRLIFLDENGCPTFTPTAEQLGVNGGTISWEKSQIRTFRYAPWNFARQSFDTDRCGIEKGSVFVVEGGTIDSPMPSYVGSYKNEGFGKVIYNPAFLDDADDGSGRAKIKVSDKSISCAPVSSTEADSSANATLVNYLCKRKMSEDLIEEAYRIVNKFLKEHANRFGSEGFSSQWGNIRSIAGRCRTKAELKQKLFAPKIGYLTHGKAKERWDEYKRRETLENLINTLNDNNAQIVLVNLASEMAKRCKKGGAR